MDAAAGSSSSSWLVNYSLKSSAVIIGLIAHLLLRNFWAKRRAEREELLKKENKFWNRAIFFPNLRLATTHPHSPTSRLETCLQRAQKSIQVCIMTIHGKQAQRFLHVLVQQHRAGLKVQVYTSAAPGTARALQFLRKNGIPTRSKSHAYSTTMHHKFVIIDRRAALTGSLNWTDDAMNRDRNNVLITNEPAVVRGLCEEFAKLWEFYDVEE